MLFGRLLAFIFPRSSRLFFVEEDARVSDDTVVAVSTSAIWFTIVGERES
jgi:hypothetical protein